MGFWLITSCPLLLHLSVFYLHRTLLFCVGNYYIIINILDTTQKESNKILDVHINNHCLHAIPFCSYFFLYQLIKLIELVGPAPPAWLFVLRPLQLHFLTALHDCGGSSDPGPGETQHTIRSLDLRVGIHASSPAGVSEFLQGVPGEEETSLWHHQQLCPPDDHLHNLLRHFQQPKHRVGPHQSTACRPHQSVFVCLSVSCKLYDNQISWNMQDAHENNWQQWCLPRILYHPYYVLTVRDSHYITRYGRYLGVTSSVFAVVVCLLQFSPSRWASCCSHSRFQPGKTFCFVLMFSSLTDKQNCVSHAPSFPTAQVWRTAI